MKDSDYMYTFNDNLNKIEYDKFVENYSMASFMQEYEWSNVKDNWKSLHCGLYKNNKLVGVCSILIKPIIKKLCIFYIPRGYLIDFTNYEDLKEMTLNIKKLAKKYHAYCVKIDPNFCISDNGFKNNEVEHNYSKDYDIKNKNLLKLGYKNTGLNKEIGKNLQPQYNIFVPLCDEKSEILKYENLVYSFKNIKRYIGNYHSKRGISFEITNDLNKIDDFVKLLKETEKKQNINLRNKEYFTQIMKSYKDEAYFAFASIDLNKYIEFLKSENKDDQEIKKSKDLLKINKDGKMKISTALVLIPKNKKGIRTSEYLYAGNSLELTNLHASVGLVSEICNFSIKKGCHYCNLGGVNGNLNDNLTKFKEKFNGRIMIFCGEYDLPINWIYYPIKTFYPTLLKIYKKIR